VNCFIFCFSHSKPKNIITYVQKPVNKHKYQNPKKQVHKTPQKPTLTHHHPQTQKPPPPHKKPKKQPQKTNHQKQHKKQNKKTMKNKPQKSLSKKHPGKKPTTKNLLARLQNP